MRQELSTETFVGGKRVVKCVRLGRLPPALLRVKAKVVYLYDFGDDWRHDIVAEKILPAAPGVAYPYRTGGRGETPEEDSGGTWAFNKERAEGGIPGGSFDPAPVTEALAHLAAVISRSDRIVASRIWVLGLTTAPAEPVQGIQARHSTPGN